MRSDALPARERPRPPSWRRRILPHSLAVALILSVACVGNGPTEPQFGTIEVRVATTGFTLDDDGYQLIVDGGPGRPIGVNESAFLQVTTGSHTLDLTGVAVNCGLPGGGQVSAIVGVGDTVRVALDVTCKLALRSQIVFTRSLSSFVGRSDFPTIADLWVMDVDGSNQTQLTTGSGGEAEAAISPDGTQIAFTSDRDGNTDIFLMTPDGANIVNLTNSPEAERTPAWSPDGTKLVFQRAEDLWVMDADGSNPIQLTSGPAIDDYPAWSPDGTSIVFESDDDIWVIASDGTGALNLTASPGRDIRPSWSPDGTWIAFTSNRNGPFKIALMKADGSNLTELPSDSPDPWADSDQEPAWSPDGTRISFERNHFYGGWNILAMDADGSDQVSLTSSPTNDVEPDWSP